MALEEDNSEHYSTLASYYSMINNSDLSIQYYERGLTYCQNSNDKALFYSNLADEYINVKKYEKAEEYLNKSININSKDAYVWFLYGNLKQIQDKNLEAFEYFEKSIKERKMDNFIQGQLFYSYSLCCLNLEKCDLSKEYIIKALDIEPNNYTYQFLYNQIKNCNAKAN